MGTTTAQRPSCRLSWSFATVHSGAWPVLRVVAASMLLNSNVLVAALA